MTGGAGFLGAALCRRLLSEENEVFCLDNLYSGYLENIKDYMNNPRFHFIEHDVTEPFDIRVDRIFHLACPASPGKYQKDSVYTSKVCFLGAINMLELARKYDARILLTSTSEIYGDPEIHPQTESYRGNINPIGIRSCYGEGKRIAESLFFDYHRQYGVQIKVARLFNVYGPEMNSQDGRVIANFVYQALNGEDITIFGNGRQTRSFCYIDDCIGGLIKLMDKDDFTGPVNIGNPEEITIQETAEMILRLTKSTSEIVYRDLPFDDERRRRPSIDLAKKELCWEPKVKLEDGVRMTISAYSKMMK